jgi:hypothetical protein
MGKILWVFAIVAFLAACSYSDTEGSTIPVPRDHEGDVDEPLIK